MEGAMEGAVTALTCTASRAPWTKVEGFKVQVCITLGQKNVTLTSVPTSVDLKHEYTQRQQHSRHSLIVHAMTAMESMIFSAHRANHDRWRAPGSMPYHN